MNFKKYKIGNQDIEISCSWGNIFIKSNGSVRKISAPLSTKTEISVDFTNPEELKTFNIHELDLLPKGTPMLVRQHEQEIWKVATYLGKHVNGKPLCSFSSGYNFEFNYYLLDLPKLGEE